jgi:hypothetical protein
MQMSSIALIETGPFVNRVRLVLWKKGTPCICIEGSGNQIILTREPSAKSTFLTQKEASEFSTNQ